MSKHKCIIYGLYGAGSRVTVELEAKDATIEPRPIPALPRSIVERVVITRNKHIKPTNGTKLALR